MSEPQDVLQALRKALAAKEDKADLKRSKVTKSEDEEVGPQKVKSKNVS